MPVKKSIQGYNWSVFFLVASFLLVTFRHTIGLTIGGGVANGMLFVFFVSSLVFWLFKVFIFSFDRASFFISVYVAWCVLLVFLYGLVSDVGSYIVPLVGFFNVCGLLILFSCIYSYTLDRYQLFCLGIKVVVFICLFNAVGAIIQYYLSESIFGLVSHAVYTDAEVLSDVNVNKRAISFISSPQSLSLFLAFGFVIVPSVVRSKLSKCFFYFLIFLLGF